MTPATALLAFSVAAILLTLTPGLDTALVLRTAASTGARQALMAGFGVCLGCLAWGAVVALGLGSLLMVSTLAYDALRYAGAAYLFWLGAKLLWNARPGARGTAAAPADEAPQTALPSGADAPLRWFTRGFLTNLLNPKIGVFYATFLPQFIPAGVSVLGFSLLLAGIHAAMGMAWFAVLVAATRPLGRWLARPSVKRAMDRVTGLVFVAFGLRLVLERR
jgi:threonine/homoserine/homoserine lactone efflux protein